MPDDALQGVRVLDLASELGLPCTRFLADLGADVIKVEQPGGDDTRQRPPFAGDKAEAERSLYFQHFNGNKRGVTLDLSKPDGQALFRRLAEQADVVVETFEPGTMAGWGIDYEALAKINPALIFTSITLFGQTGPWRDYKGGELIAFALSGLMALSGEPNSTPVLAPGELSSGMASMHAALAIQVALWHRLQSGKGQYIDVSVAEAAAHIGSYAVPFYSYHKQKAERVSHLETTFELHDVYPCKDGWVRLFINPPEHWVRLLEWMGNPPEISDPLFEDRHMRSENSDLIDPYVRELCNRYTKKEIYMESQSRHLAVTPMNTPGEFVESEQTKARRLFQDVDHPAIGKLPQMVPMHRGAEPEPPRRPAPTIGQHNDEVFGELGLSAAEISGLRARGVL